MINAIQNFDVASGMWAYVAHYKTTYLFVVVDVLQLKSGDLANGGPNLRSLPDRHHKTIFQVSDSVDLSRIYECKIHGVCNHFTQPRVFNLHDQNVFKESWDLLHNSS